MARPGTLSKSATFNLLLMAALVLVFLPPAVSGWLRQFVQPVGLVQRPITSMGRWAREGLFGVPTPAGAATDLNELQQRVALLERQLINQELRFEALRTTYAEVATLHDLVADEGARLIRARVIGPVADQRTAALRINKGHLAGVARDQWVAAARREAEEMGGRERLARQWVIGRVLEVRPYEAVVQLTTDPGFRAGVRVARFDPGAAEPIAAYPEPATLFGLGDEAMEIRDATRDYPADGAAIVLLPESRQLPTPLTVGRIVSSRRLDATQLHFDLQVVPWSDPRQLDRVYVIALAP